MKDCRQHTKLVLFTLSMWLNVGMAQSISRSAASSTVEAGDVLEEVVVTAQKKTEDLQHVPVAVTAISGDDLVVAGVEDVTGLETIAPSVKITSRAQQALVYIRGIGSSVAGANVDPAVAFNVNGVYVPSEMTTAAFFDVGQVEVVPGPQGTLYGRNSSGGTINVVTRLPGTELGGEGYLEAGNYDAVNVFSAADLPVNDVLGLRVAGLSQHHSSYLEGTGGPGGDEADSTNARITVKFDPTDRTSILASATYAHQGGLPNSVQNNPLPPEAYRVPFNAQALGLFQDFDTWLSSLQLDQKLNDAITLTYLAGYSDFTGGDKLVLFTAGPATVQEIFRRTLLTQELRLSGQWDQLNWIAGGYFYTSNGTYGAHVLIPIPIVDQGPYTVTGKGYAGFTQGTYAINDAVRVTGGARFSSDRQAIFGSNGLTIPGVVSDTTPYSGEQSHQRVDWKIGGEFDINRKSMLYASVQTGFNQGGFSNAVPSVGSTEAVPFQPATLLAYTVGSKGRFWRDRLELNLEAFYYDYKNYQVSARNLATGASQIYNAQKAKSYGVQLDSKIRITQQDRLDVSLGLLRAVADELLIAGAGDYGGYSLPYSPVTTVNGSYNHSWFLPDGASVDGRVAAEYNSSTWMTYNHLDGTFKPDFTKLDANLTYNAARKWSVALYGYNLTNKAIQGITNGGATPGPGGTILNPPRTYGVRFAAKF